MEITKDNYFALKSQKLLRKEIAEIFNVPEWKLKKIIAKNKWGAVKPSINNLNAFNQEKELDYYWAGFIAADGNISDKNDLYVCLHYDDCLHLEKLLLFLNSNHAISKNTDKYYRAQIGLRLPEAMAEILKNKFNIIPRKSLIYELPDIYNSENFKHFLRGYFDGDGCICESFSNKNSKTASIYATITGSNNFINKLHKIMPFKGSIQQKHNVSTIKYNTNAAKELLNYLYKDASIYLDRKYILYNTLILNNLRKIR